jgi:hypothetical protein
VLGKLLPGGCSFYRDDFYQKINCCGTPLANKDTRQNGVNKKKVETMFIKLIFSR